MRYGPAYRMRETDLYAPLKAYLEGQGYEVKAEIGDCDLMARRGSEPPVVVEMKLTFSLGLVMQGVDRQKMFEVVYLAVPVSSDRGWKRRYKEIIHLCRRLGLGLLAVRTGPKAKVTPHLDPGAYEPRKNTRRSGRLLKEDHYGWFERVSRGVYALTPRGVTELGEYGDIAESLR